MSNNKIESICFFTDQKSNHFEPLTLTRPLDDLRVGIYTIREKWMKTLGVEKSLHLLPKYLEGVFNTNTENLGSKVLWINSRFFPSAVLSNEIEGLKIGEMLSFKGDIVCALCSKSNSLDFISRREFSREGFRDKEVRDLIHIENIWDLLTLNEYEIEKDIPLTGLCSAKGKDINLSSVHHPKNTYLGEQVEIEPGVHIIAKEGPVVIMDGAHLEVGSIIRGPVVIGENATVKMNARIYGATTIGPVCKVAGEISNCIFHSYSNKAHDGFTGNSLFGQWVNLGADTNTSNLKNNYSTVRLADWGSRKETDTEMQFLGTIMADHSKTSINTMLNTGTICGVSSNIFMGGFPPKYIPSFSWVGSEDFGEYNFPKAIEAMRAMMKRRDVELTQSYEQMMKHLFQIR